MGQPEDQAEVRSGQVRSGCGDCHAPGRPAWRDWHARGRKHPGPAAGVLRLSAQHCQWHERGRAGRAGFIALLPQCMSDAVRPATGPLIARVGDREMLSPATGRAAHAASVSEARSDRVAQRWLRITESFPAHRRGPSPGAVLVARVPSRPNRRPQRQPLSLSPWTQDAGTGRRLQEAAAGHGYPDTTRSSWVPRRVGVGVGRRHAAQSNNAHEDTGLPAVSFFGEAVLTMELPTAEKSAGKAGVPLGTRVGVLASASLSDRR